MKKVISGLVLKEKMKESINLLCDTVKTTLGPKGNNIIIDHSSFTPFITNDGATIAKNIESEDEIINTILEIAKEASLKTNDLVGDGTTTTLVLLQSIFNASLKYIEEGINPIHLKRELDNTLKSLTNHLTDLKLPPTKNSLQNIAKIAANDEEIGNFVSNIFEKIDNKNALSIKETEENILKVNYIQGYNLEIDLASFYFLKGNLTLAYDKTYLLIINDTLRDIENISAILNDVRKNNQNLIIIANEFDEYFINEIVSLVLNDSLNCCLLKISEYGNKQRIIEQDLEIITGAKIVEDVEKITFNNIGIVNNVNINNKTALFTFEKNKEIKEYINKLKLEEKDIKDDFEKNFYQKRIAMFTSGLAEIEIGAQTKTECHEKRMRLDDAICAIESAKNGVLPGGGLALLKLTGFLKNNNTAESIFKEALEKPFEQILLNSGLDYEKIKKEIKDNEYNLVFNVDKNQFEDIKNTMVIDSLNVTLNSLKNACSIATMLLTTTSIVINEHENNTNKITEFNEL